jgi:hypothetical protein
LKSSGPFVSFQVLTAKETATKEKLQKGKQTGKLQVLFDKCFPVAFEWNFWST